MAVEKERAAKAGGKRRKLPIERAMIGPIGVFQPAFEFLGAYRPPPQMAVRCGSRRDDAEAGAGARARPKRAVALDMGRVDFLFAAIAVDRGPRRRCDDGRHSLPERPPDEAVDERVFERLERFQTVPGQLQKPVGIVAAGVGHRHEHRKLPARRVQNRGRKHRYRQLSQIRTDIGRLQRSTALFASSQNEPISA